MSTNNISDDELDDLFRKSAGNSDPPYDPEAWKAMEKKLDGVDGGPSGRHKFIYPLLLLLICTVVAIVKLAQEPERVTTAGSENKTVNGRQQAGQKDGENIQLPLQDEQKLPVDVHTEKKTITGTGAGAQSSGAIRADESSKVTDRKLSGSDTKTLRAGNDTKAAVSSKHTAEQQVTSPTLLSKTQQSKATENAQTEEKPDQEPLSSGLVVPDSTQLLVAEDKGLSQETDSSNLNNEAKSKSAFLRSMQLMVLVAPDVTTVKFRNPEAISANAGVIVGISITKRISILSGVIWANKVYEANPEDYAPSPNYWYGRKLPTSIDAVCKVLDIPLNIRFQLLERDKNIFAIQTGISNYIMLQEKYTYNYDTNSNTLEISNQNKHWFGVQNVSVSYSRKLSPVFSVGVEPFVKIPLTGIGAGQVNLASAGIFLTAGYTISLRR